MVVVIHTMICRFVGISIWISITHFSFHLIVLLKLSY